MASHSVAQRVFPAGTAISVYNAAAVESMEQSGRAPLATPVAAISAGNSGGVAATLTVDPAGANNALDYAAKTKGIAGNNITVAYVNDGASQTLDVDLGGASGKDITVSLATDGSSVITSTGTTVAAAIAAHAGANALVSVANTAANSGAGLVTVMAKASFSGGVDPFTTTQAVIAADGTLTVDVGTNADFYAVGVVNGEYAYLRFNVDAP